MVVLLPYPKAINDTTVWSVLSHMIHHAGVVNTGLVNRHDLPTWDRLDPDRHADKLPHAAAIFAASSPYCLATFVTVMGCA